MSELERLKNADNLKDYAERNLEKSKGGLYCCPICGSGTHGNRTGALSIDNRKPFLFKCFACGFAGSVIDLIKAVESKNTGEAINRLRELYDPDYETNRKPGTSYYSSGKKKGEMIMEAKQALQGNREPALTSNSPADVKMNFRNYYVRCQNMVDKTNYPEQRGLDKEIVMRFGLGYDPAWISHRVRYLIKQENKRIEKENRKRKETGQSLLPLKHLPPPSPRFIIPISENNYFARDTRPNEELTDLQKKYSKQNEGKDKPFFNLAAMENPVCFFVVEGEIDALSVEQAGGSCVGLGSAQRAKSFVDVLVAYAKEQQKNNRRTGTVVICLDNDQAGMDAADLIENACMIAGLDYLFFNLSGNFKDPNEYLVNDRQGFYNNVKGVIFKIREEKLKGYALGDTAHGVDKFMRRTKYPAIGTGFKNLDGLLNGGFPSSGLIFIGGLASIGKTSFVLQVAEHMATNRYPKDSQDVLEGKDVLYFALEQSEEDLLSKILSRRMYKKCKKSEIPILAKSNWQLLQEDRQGWPQKAWDILWSSYIEYKKSTGGHLRILESPGRLSALDIIEYTKEHVAITGRAPVIVIDYLQILRPVSDKLTDKQAVDATIVLLKQLSRDYNTCVIGISSFNRQNYWQPVNMTAYKDTGNLEYSADLLLALAPAGMQDTTDTDEKEEKVKTDNKRIVDDCKEAEVKNIQLHVLKNRNGRITGRKNKLLFTYQAKYNCFEEAAEESYLNYFDNGNPMAINGKKRIII